MNFHLLRKHLGIPYVLFLLICVVAPVLVIGYYAFTNGQGEFSADNFFDFFTSGNTMGTLIYSFVLSAVVTCVCVVVAYPVAYILSKLSIKRRQALLLLFVIPMWINFTLRITALKEILNVLEGNLARYPFLNTVIGQTYDFLPFMILPIYTNLIKIDRNLGEAAADLGAGPFEVFRRVILPLSMPGVLSGIMMVFLPAMTNYVILDMLYNSTYIMGSLIGSYFSAYNWHKGSMISIILLVIVFIGAMASDRIAGDEEAADRGTLL